MSAVLKHGEARHVDAVVVGAGLGGLSTALRLQQLGLSVLVLDKSDRVGGLCGTVEHGGLPRVIACNDFGKGVLKDLADMGVSHPFERTRTRIVHRGQAYSLPPDMSTLGKLSTRLPSIWRYLKGMRQARQSGFQPIASLERLMAHSQIDARTADLLMLPAYLMGVSPDRFRLDALDDEFQHGYGYTHPVTPSGGPQALADAMAHQFRRRGGEIMLGCEFLHVSTDEAQGKQAWTTRGPIRCELLVSTLPAAQADDGMCEPGLPISMLWLTVSTAYRFPAGIHTHVHYPPGIRQWFGDIYDGRLPDEFAFHVFSSDVPHPKDRFTANVYFYLPKGQEEDPYIQDQAQHYIFSQLEGLLPGLRQHILASHMVSPAVFKARHGFEARVTPLITRVGTPKPGNYCAVTDTYFAGAAAYPPGDHAGAAIRSSRHVAQLVARQYSRRHIEAA